MKIKQQKQIKTFLTEEYGNEKGNTIFDRQTEILDELIKNTRGKSPQKWRRSQGIIFFTAGFFSRSSAQLTCGKVSNATIRILLTSP